jgi:hypothetical protein
MSESNHISAINIAADNLGNDEKAFLQALNRQLANYGVDGRHNLNHESTNAKIADYLFNLPLTALREIRAEAKSILKAESYVHFLNEPSTAEATHFIDTLNADIRQIDLKDPTARKQTMQLFEMRLRQLYSDDLYYNVAAKILHQQLPDWIEHALQIKKMVSEGFIEQWADGKFAYETPYFRNDRDTHRFINRWSSQLHCITHNILLPKDPHKAPESYITDELSKKITEHEKPLRAKQIEAEKQRLLDQAEELKRKNEEETKRQKLEEAEKWARTFQPYQLSTDAGSVIYWASQTNNKQFASKKMAMLTNNIPKHYDIRDVNMAELGNLLFSGANLVRLGNALGIEGQMRNASVAPCPGIAARIRKLNALYTSDSAHSAIENLLQDNNGILLLAMLTESELGKKYAHFLQSADQRIAHLLEEQMNVGFTITEILQLEQEGEPQILEMRAAQKALLEEVNAAREILAKEIRQSLIDKIKKPTAASEHTFVSASNQEAPDTIPGDWMEVLGEFLPHTFSITPTKSAKSYSITCEQHPHLHSELKKEAPVSEFKKTLIKLHATAIRQEAVDKKAASMARQVSLLRSCVRAGIHVENVDKDMISTGPITLWLPDLSKHSFTSKGVFSDEDFIAVQDILDNLPKKTLPIAKAVVPEPSEEPPAGKAAIADWKPQPDQTVMLFDANVFEKLAAGRQADGHKNKYERTWLDMLKQTAKLPNICIIIPSTIADLELRGQVPYYDEKQQRSLRQFDERYTDKNSNLGYIKKACDNFFVSASRGVMANDGSITLEPGANQNIIILETPADRKLYERIYPLLGPEHLHEGIQFRIKELHGQDKGELAINDILWRLPKIKHAVVVSDDINYFNNAARKKTGKGAPVLHSSMQVYLDAELSAMADINGITVKREEALNDALKEGGILSVDAICRDISNDWKNRDKEKNVSFPSHCSIWEPVAKQITNIYGIISDGFQKQAEQAKPHDAENSENKTGYASDKLRNITTARPINPQNINDRPDDMVRGA